MIPSAPIFAVADDLTGAAEIAALGHRFGLLSMVVTATERHTAGAGLVVCDTDSRLATPEHAANAVRQAAADSAAQPGAALYKKVDSVLRGNVLAEVESLASVADRPRVLLVPANPAFGRTIRDGCYFVDGTPIHQTDFAQDPHHPAMSPRIADLLGVPRQLPVHILAPGAVLPPAGVIVGEAGSADDVAHWARRVDPTTLPAGGAEFFSAWLRTLGHETAAPAAVPELEGPLLVVSGTTVASSRAMLSSLFSAGLPVIPMVESIVCADDAVAAHRWAEDIALNLAARGVAITVAPTRLSTAPGVVAAIRLAFATLVKRLQSRAAFAHLVIEGGATAAAIVQALGWTELTVVGEWTHGIVTLRPVGDPQRRLTLKPGSYPWPGWWWDRLTTVSRDTRL